MPTGVLTRTGIVASATFRSAFSGARALGLIAVAAVYPLLVVVIAAAQFPGIDLLGTSETLFSTLFLPVLLLLVVLVLGVGAFRGELEDDTLVFPLNRTLPRPSLVAGKYLGLVGAALLILIPSALGGTALAAALGTGPSPNSTGLLEAILLLPTLAILAYGANFLFLGLVTRQALVIGLLYGFLWETFISLIPGPIRELSVIYYLRGVGANLVPNGDLASGVGALGVPGVLVGTFGFALVALVLSSLFLRYAEIRPAAAPS